MCAASSSSKETPVQVVQLDVLFGHRSRAQRHLENWNFRRFLLYLVSRLRNSICRRYFSEVKGTLGEFVFHGNQRQINQTNMLQLFFIYFLMASGGYKTASALATKEDQDEGSVLTNSPEGASCDSLGSKRAERGS